MTGGSLPEGDNQHQEFGVRSCAGSRKNLYTRGVISGSFPRRRGSVISPRKAVAEAVEGEHKYTWSP